MSGWWLGEVQTEFQRTSDVMPRWTIEDLANYERRKLAVSAARAPRLPTVHAEPVKGKPLDCQVSGEAAGRARVKIRFSFYSRRPCDWDAYSVKELQDLLVHAGILDSDQWDSLQGEIISEKVQQKEEERTEITFESILRDKNLI